MQTKNQNEKPIERMQGDFIINTQIALEKKECNDIGQKRNSRCKFTILKEKMLIESYKDGKTLVEISKTNNIAKTTLNNILEFYKVKKRKRQGIFKYSCDVNFFDKIDSPEKAYILGFLYADGCVSKSVILSLQEKDKHILDEMSSILKSDHPLIFVEKQQKQYQNTYKLYIHNQHFRQSLIKLGCVPRKSFVLKFPTRKQVPKKLIRHFIRGYFDGDGCIYLHPEKHYICYVGIVSTFKFIKELRKILQEELEIDCSVRRLNKRGQKNYCVTNLTISKQSSILKFKEWIYENSSMHLNRKLIKFEIFSNYFKNKEKKYVKLILISPKNKEFYVDDVVRFCKLKKLRPSSIYRLKQQPKHIVCGGWRLKEYLA